MIELFLVFILISITSWYFYQQTRKPDNFPPGRFIKDVKNKIVFPTANFV